MRAHNSVCKATRVKDLSRAMKKQEKTFHFNSWKFTKSACTSVEIQLEPLWMVLSTFKTASIHPIPHIRVFHRGVQTFPSFPPLIKMCQIIPLTCLQSPLRLLETLNATKQKPEFEVTTDQIKQHTPPQRYFFEIYTSIYTKPGTIL